MQECPECEVTALVRGAVTAAAPDAPTDLCFHCGTSFGKLEECSRCGAPFDPADGMACCDTCLHAMVNDGT